MSLRVSLSEVLRWDMVKFQSMVKSVKRVKAMEMKDLGWLLLCAQAGSKDMQNWLTKRYGGDLAAYNESNNDMAAFNARFGMGV